MVVDLPAPFGPTKPVTWPGKTENDIPSSACAEPNRLRSPATSIVASMGRKARDRVPLAVVTPRSGLRWSCPGVPNVRVVPPESDTPAARRGGRGRAVQRGQWLAWVRTGSRGSRPPGTRRRSASRLLALAAVAQAIAWAAVYSTGSSVVPNAAPVLPASRWLPRSRCWSCGRSRPRSRSRRPTCWRSRRSASRPSRGWRRRSSRPFSSASGRATARCRASRGGARAQRAGRVPGACRFSSLALSGDVERRAARVARAGGGGGRDRAARQARGGRADRTREVLTDTLTQHMARGERARIARELHDVVAHHISMIAVQAETARLTTPGLPAAGAQRFAEIGDTARAGLTEMRRLLGVLREDADATVADRHPQPGLPQLAELIDTARDASGHRHTADRVRPGRRVRPGGRARRLPDRAGGADQRAAARARRRGGRGAALRRRRAAAADPRQRPRAGLRGRRRGAEPPGHGLLGMRERALAVGGSLRTGAAPGGGFCVEAVLPAKPETAAGAAPMRSAATPEVS